MLRIQWSPINRAWLVRWGDLVLRIFNDKTDAEYYVSEIMKAKLEI